MTERRETGDRVEKASTGGASDESAASVRAILQTIARLISTDRRAVVLASESAEILLANATANRLGFDSAQLRKLLDWPDLCQRARRAGSVPVSVPNDKTPMEGELVSLPLGRATGYLLRLAENDLEATWLRNRARAATLMRVSHDLRTPIQSLLATAQSVLDMSDREGAYDKAAARDQLQHAADLALDHISNVLGVIKGEQSLAGLKPDEDFNLTEELRSLVAMVSPIAKARGAEVRVRFDPPQDVWVHGPVRFVRALCQNMLDNSVKYGGDVIELVLKATPLGQAIDDAATTPGLSIAVEVRDQGGGLPVAQKARLMEALGKSGGRPSADEQCSTNDRRPSAGLNVLAHAIRQLGGAIEVYDRGPDGAPCTSEVTGAHPGEVTGTILRAVFTLETAEPRIFAKESIPAVSLADPGESPLNGLGVLIVEDSPSSREWLVHVLRAAGAEVVSAGNGMEALSLLERGDVAQAIDLVMTDMTLPFMNGVEFARRVRARQGQDTQFWQGPILALTAHVGDEIRHACRDAGIVRVLEKPIRPKDLHEALLKAAADVEAQDDQSASVAKRVATLTDSEEAMEKTVVEELVSQLGLEGARGFMRRALQEAHEVFDELKAEGVGEDMGRKLHAATGACGLTGLSLVERNLRALESAVETGQMEFEDLFRTLEQALADTGRAVEGL